MKQITITVPDNCELKQDGNTYTIVEKEKKLTYEDVAIELFFDKTGFYINNHGDMISASAFDDINYTEGNNCTSKKQARKLLAINKLMNVAKYLNGDWQPKWNIDEAKYYIYIIHDELRIDTLSIRQCLDIYFKSEELARQAIDILGEDVIKLALSTDY